jgi:SNF2 family DNA or RNA helicase
LFVDGGRIAGRMLQDANIDFLYYFGSMSNAEKHQAIKDFTEKNNIRVLVSRRKDLNHLAQN